MLSKPQEFMLFLLGMCHEHCNNHIKGPLKLELRKSDFIALAKSAGLVGKSPRAMYRNLELLEKANFISYKNSRLSLTKKGQSNFNKKLKMVQPYIEVDSMLKSTNLLRYFRKTQLSFKN